MIKPYFLEEMENIKVKIDTAKAELQRKESQIKENKQVAENLLLKIQHKIKEKEKIRDRVRMKVNKKFSYEKECETQQEALSIVKKHIEDINELISKNNEKIDELSRNLVKLTKEDTIYAKKTNEMIQEKEFTILKKDQMTAEVEIISAAVEEHKKLRESVKEEIDHQVKERGQTTKNLKKAEDDDHDLFGDITYVKNKLKKLQNQVRGYQIEAQKLNRTISQLEKEREKYGIEASQAHAKYYQTIEEVKIKNNMISELQKKNAEVEAKLKHQQNLYEAVRSDRNLYSKNLLESQDEIAELMKKFTRMTHQVDQLKEQIKVKNADLIKQDFDFKKIVDENDKTKNEKHRIIKNIDDYEKLLKNQESNISKLKYIITEAKSEKQKQEKDYEMVVNERDILGTQLIKRNQELGILYEKIKLSQSNLTKGEIYFREKQGELKGFQGQLTGLRKELTSTVDQVKFKGNLIEIFSF